MLKLNETDVIALCEPETINAFYLAIERYMYDGILDRNKHKTIDSYILMDYETKVSLVMYLFHNWRAMFTDMCNGTTKYINMCDILYDDINDYLS